MVRLVCSVLLLTTLSCAPSGPRLERADGAAWVDIAPLELMSIDGFRDGERVEARIYLAGDAVDFRLAFEIVLGPPASFVRGTHESVIAGERSAGPLSAEYVDFLGGQNAAPSVGGVFIVEVPDTGARYRLRVPATPLRR